MRIGRTLLSIIMRRVFCLLAIVGIIVVEGRKVLLDNFELERRLKLINKPPIKSIKMDYAIFDCIDVYKQPAFDHPLLANHKIQFEPHQLPSQARKKTSHRRDGFGGLFPGCPDGTVPIRRATKEDLIREQSIENMKISNFYPKSPNGDSNITSFATVYIDNKKPFFGAETYINIQQPEIFPGEASGAQVWLFKASNDRTVINGISAGWLVDSDLYGDNRTYFTISWMREDGFEPVGCFNIRCPGFVQVDPTTPIGYLLKDVSEYGGRLTDMHTRIYRDPDTGHWWLIAGEEDSRVGYWPNTVVTGIGNGGNNLHFGGVVKSIPTQSTSPSMGSGFSEECEFTHTAFFSNVGYMLDPNDTSQVIAATDDDTNKYVDCENYKVLPSCKPIDIFKYYFLYGGSRGKC